MILNIINKTFNDYLENNHGSEDWRLCFDYIINYPYDLIAYLNRLERHKFKSNTRTSIGPGKNYDDNTARISFEGTIESLCKATEELIKVKGIPSATLRHKPFLLNMKNYNHNSRLAYLNFISVCQKYGVKTALQDNGTRRTGDWIRYL